jgi:hypothetical protein
MDDFFLSYLRNWFQSVFLWKCISIICWTCSEEVKNGHIERGCRWFQLFFIDFSYFIFEPGSSLYYTRKKMSAFDLIWLVYMCSYVLKDSYMHLVLPLLNMSSKLWIYIFRGKQAEISYVNNWEKNHPW